MASLLEPLGEQKCAPRYLILSILLVASISAVVVAHVIGLTSFAFDISCAFARLNRNETSHGFRAIDFKGCLNAKVRTLYDPNTY